MQTNNTWNPDKTYKLSVVIPCYNEEKTLEKCVERVMKIKEKTLNLEIIIVDDASTDNSVEITNRLIKKHPEIILCKHEHNQGKGAALRTGFKKASGDFVAVQDADLEYDPQDLKRLLIPLIENEADVVLGSRFQAYGAHRVLYFWHYVGNRFLTLLSNMFTDLNLTDMETCYKVFRRDVIQNIEIKENRFGFEPEIVAKIAHRRLKIYEIGISYHGRTYEEGKKIGVSDGFRALYCIFRYNAHKAPVPIQFLIYLFIGGAAALVNLFVFLGLFSAGYEVHISAPVAFIVAAIANYILSITLLFRHKARWNSFTEIIMYIFVVGLTCLIDYGMTALFMKMGFLAVISKIIATTIGLFLNFVGRRFLVFPEPPSGDWK